MPLFKVGLGIAIPERTVPFMLTDGTFLFQIKWYPPRDLRYFRIHVGIPRTTS